MRREARARFVEFVDGSVPPQANGTRFVIQGFYPLVPLEQPLVGLVDGLLRIDVGRLDESSRECDGLPSRQLKARVTGRHQHPPHGLRRSLAFHSHLPQRGKDALLDAILQSRVHPMLKAAGTKCRDLEPARDLCRGQAYGLHRRRLAVQRQDGVIRSKRGRSRRNTGLADRARDGGPSPGKHLICPCVERLVLLPPPVGERRQPGGLGVKAGGYVLLGGLKGGDDGGHRLGIELLKVMTPPEGAGEEIEGKGIVWGHENRLFSCSIA